jgi:hypothetical protein
MRRSIRQRVGGIECPMLLNYDMEEAGFTSLLTPSEGRFSTPKGDIRIRTRPLTRLAEKPGSTMGGATEDGAKRDLPFLFGTSGFLPIRCP